jgi:hypothetical protein
MTVRGAAAPIPPQMAELQPHIRILVSAIHELLQKEFGLTLSNACVQLMKTYLNKSRLHFQYATQNYNNKHRLLNNYFRDESHLTSLILTIKYFHLFLKRKLERHSNFDELFKTEYDIFAAFTCASLLADKLSYEQLSPEISDVHDVFEVLYSNTIEAFRGIFNDESFTEDEWCKENRNTHVEFLDMISKYEPMDSLTLDALASITDNLPEDLKLDFRKYFIQLKVLVQFLGFDNESRVCAADDEFSFDSCLNAQDHYDINDYESISDITSSSDSDSISHTTSSIACESESSSYAGSGYGEYQVDKLVTFTLGKLEKEFLETLKYQFQVSFTLIEAYQLLYKAERFVNSPNLQVVHFTMYLSTFGEFKREMENLPELGILPSAPPSTPSILPVFEQVRRARSRNAEPEQLKPSLQRLSY